MGAAYLKDRMTKGFAQLGGNILQGRHPAGTKVFAGRHPVPVIVSAVTFDAAVLFAIIEEGHTRMAGLTGTGEEFFVAVAALQLAPLHGRECSLGNEQASQK